MKTRRLADTDLDLSIVGFGGWAIGGQHWGDDVTEARSVAAIHEALALGVNWIDTAPIYGKGRSEEVIRKALADRPGRAIVATKVGVVWVGDHAQSHLTAANVRADLEATLKRLGTDCIDLLQVHWPCEFGTPFEETYGALDALRREGKFRHLGVCNYNASALTEIAQITQIASLQTGYSLLRREAEHGLTDTAASLNIGVLAYEPLGRGLLTNKYAFPPGFPESDMRRRDDRFQGSKFFRIQKLAADLAQVAAKVGVPTAALAIGWVASRPGVTSVVCGAKGPEQVREHVQAARCVDHAKLWDVVDRIAAKHGGNPR